MILSCNLLERGGAVGDGSDRGAGVVAEWRCAWLCAARYGLRGIDAASLNFDRSSQ